MSVDESSKFMRSLYGTEAVYRKQNVPSYQDNPFIEALPPIVDNKGAIDAMQHLLHVDSAHRELPAHERMHMLEDIKGRKGSEGVKGFMQPLGQHVDLFHRISILIRRGYVQRNPLDRNFIREMLAYLDQLERAPTFVSAPPSNSNCLGPGSGLTLIGRSGVGKTSAVGAVLKCYPDQVINHGGLIKGPFVSVSQLVWLKLTCPPDGSLRGLCVDFFAQVDKELGTNYSRMYASSHATVDTMRVHMARVAFIHGLGLLVIDEIQHLNQAKSGGARIMMNFFKLLADVMQVPVLTIGTPEAKRILGGDDQNARRHSGMPPFAPMKLDEEFGLFCEGLFEAQYLRSPIKLDATLLQLLHYLSQGLADVVVKLFITAQYRALSCGLETLSEGLFRGVYNDCFGMLHPFLEAMRRGVEPDDRLMDEVLSEITFESMTRAASAPVLVSRAEAAKAAGAARPSGATDEADAEPKVRGVRKRRIRRAKGRESKCELVRVVQEALDGDVSPHAALLKAGYVRRLGDEVLTA